MPSIIDSSFPDALDEALWGIYFLVNCVNIEGYQGENARYLIWETVSGYCHWENREARMSYWGPPKWIGLPPNVWCLINIILLF